MMIFHDANRTPTTVFRLHPVNQCEALYHKKFSDDSNISNLHFVIIFCPSHFVILKLFSLSDKREERATGLLREPAAKFYPVCSNNVGKGQQVI